jgi:toxin ParE1/3/4
MAEFRLSPDAEADIDTIWLHIARESGSIDIATRVVDRIHDRFWLLATYPYMGRRRDDLRPGLRSFVTDQYLVVYRIDEDESVIILRVLHGSRDPGVLFEL